jgi:hypothetical protein
MMDARWDLVRRVGTAGLALTVGLAPGQVLWGDEPRASETATAAAVLTSTTVPASMASAAVAQTATVADTQTGLDVPDDTAAPGSSPALGSFEPSLRTDAVPGRELSALAGSAPSWSPWAMGTVGLGALAFGVGRAVALVAVADRDARRDEALAAVSAERYDAALLGYGSAESTRSAAEVVAWSGLITLGAGVVWLVVEYVTSP